MEDKQIEPFSDDEDYWDGLIQSASEENVGSGTPNIPDLKKFCQKNGIDDPSVALQLIDMITDNFESAVRKQEKEEEAPIHDAMSLQKHYTTDDDNPAQEEARNEFEWGKRIREGQEDDRSASKPVVASVQISPPITNKESLLRAIRFFSDPNNAPVERRKAIWSAISNAAKNLQVNHPVITKFRVMYNLEPVPNHEKVYSLSIPLWRVQVKSAVKCKDPENCKEATHDHQYFVEGFVTTPMKDLQGEVVKETVFPEIVTNIAKPPHNLGWLHHESPYANPNAQKAEPAIMFEQARVERNPTGKMGVWVRGKLNKMHPAFKQTWYELKEGFLNAFSMEFMPLNETQGYVDGKATNIVDSIKYLSTSLVRAPANEGAYITKVYAKSYAGLGFQAWSQSVGNRRRILTEEKTKGEVKKISEKDLGRETGTTAPERSNTAIGEWGDPTLEKGQAKLHDAQERAAALQRLKPQNMPFHPSQRRASGAAGKAIPVDEPSQVDPEADQSVQQRPRIAEPEENPEDYKAGLVKREEEEGAISYVPQSVESEATKLEEEEGKHEEEDEERRFEDAYKAVIAKRTPNKQRLMNKALDFLARKYPTMSIAEARKAAGEMTEVLGEVNAPQKISKEQKPPEVDYGKYGEPDVVAPLSTFSADVEARLKSIEKAVADVKRGSVLKRGLGPENTVRDKSVAAAAADTEDQWSVEGQFDRALRRMGVYG